MEKFATDAAYLFSSTANKLPIAHNAAANTNSQRIKNSEHSSRYLTVPQDLIYSRTVPSGAIAP